MNRRIRTDSDFVDLVDADLQWRKRELTSAWAACKAGSPKAEFQRQARAAVCLQYAHFEGFIKGCVDSYLALVSSKRLSIGELSAELVAVTLRTQLTSCAQARLMGQFVGVVHGIFRASAVVPFQDGLFNNIGNLDSQRLRDFLTITSIGEVGYETRYAFIDNKLVHYRNNVAHGQYFAVDYDALKEMHATVMSLIELFRTDIQNAAARQLYKR